MGTATTVTIKQAGGKEVTIAINNVTSVAYDDEWLLVQCIGGGGVRLKCHSKNAASNYCNYIINRM